MAGLRNSYGNNNDKIRDNNIKLLSVCRDYWESLRAIRKEGKHNRQMLQGVQWTRAEMNAIMRQGRKPLTQNITAQIMANLNGQYLSQKGSPVAVARKQDSANEGKMMSLAIEHVGEINNDNQKDSYQFERLACTGVICSRIDFGYISERDINDIITENINIHTLFFTPLVDDGQTNNIDIIGTINEDTIDGLCVNFANSQDDINFIRERYNFEKKQSEHYKFIEDLFNTAGGMNKQDDARINNLDFFISDNKRMCRYYEVWIKEMRKIIRYHDNSNGSQGISELSLDEIREINNQRIIQCIENGIPESEARLIDATERYEYVWKCRYITPDGYILKECDSPFKHQSHPYVLAFYKIADGNIHPLLSDLEPMQRYINRLTMQMDFMMGNGAKGMTFIDRAAITSSGMTQEELAEAITSFDKVVTLDVPVGKRMDELVKQIYSQPNIAPAMNVYQNTVQMMQQIMGVNSAIQGQRPSAGTPASRYAQETANAQLNSKPFLDCFAEFRRKKYIKILKLIQQYYDEEMFLQVAGKENIAYNPDVKDIDYDLTITQEITTSNYSITEDDKLFQLATQGFIDPQMYFELSHSGFAKQALELIKQRQQETQQQAMQQQGIMPNVDGQGVPQLTDEQMEQLMAMIGQGEQTPYEEIPQYTNDSEENDAELLEEFLKAQ